jgi:GT2 family glycosyltransferase
MAWNLNNINKSIQSKPLVAILIPHWGNVSMDWVENSYAPLKYIPQSDFDKVYQLARGILNLDTERNFLVKEALKNPNVTHVLFMDSDVIAEGDVNSYLRMLLQCNTAIVSGVYRAKKQNGYYPYCMFMKNPTTKSTNWDYADGFIPVDKWTGNFIETDVVGFGFILIKREVFEKMQYPWFKWNEEPSEDFTWCINAKKLEYKIQVMTDVKLSHLGQLKVKTDSSIISPGV